MATPFRAFLTTAAAFMAASCFLQAESGPWSGEIGAVSPSGGSKQWTGSTVGPSINVMQSYSLGNNDTIRMRFGYWDLKASNITPQTVIVPGGVAASYPASTTSEMFSFSYGADYIHFLPARFYVLGGLGVNYISASRTGTFDLTSAGGGLPNTTYSANNFVPYICLGAGYQITQSLALEARWQTTSMKAQQRPINLSSGGTYTTPGQAVVDKITAPVLTVGISVTF